MPPIIGVPTNFLLMLHCALQTHTGVQKVSDSIYTKALGRQSYQCFPSTDLDSKDSKCWKSWISSRKDEEIFENSITSPFVWLVAACARPKISLNQRFEKKPEAPCPPGWSQFERLWSRNTREGWRWSESKLSSPAPSPSPPWPPPWPCLPHWRPLFPLCCGEDS